MKVIATVILTSLLLSACGTQTGDRGLSGAGIGAGIGALGGPPGVVVGGAVGVLIGEALAIGLTLIPDAGLDEAHVPLWEIIMSFSFSAAVGLVFGMFPAIKASRLDPIEALRHE